MSKVKYRPLFGRVLIERKVEEKKGSIIIPDTIKKRHAKAEGPVIAIGDTAQGVKVGDRVTFGKHAGAWLDPVYDEKTGEEKDGSLYICQDEDILVVHE